MRKIVSIFFFASLGSCGLKTAETNVGEITGDSTAKVTPESGFDENNYESFLDLNNYLVESPDTPGNVQVIDSSAVIVVNPTEEQIKEMEEKYGEDFYTIADDNSYYQSDATLKLDSLHVKTIYADKRFLKLQGSKQNWIVDLRKEGAPEWNMIFFHADKEPEIVSAIDVTQEKIREYFGI